MLLQMQIKTEEVVKVESRFRDPSRSNQFKDVAETDCASLLWHVNDSTVYSSIPQMSGFLRNIVKKLISVPKTIKL